MCDKNKLKAELQGVESVLAELKDQHDRGKIDIGRYLALKKEYETSKAELEQELDSLARSQPVPAATPSDRSLTEDALINDIPPAAYCDRGFTYFLRGDYERAITDYQRYLELYPNAPDREKVECWISDIQSKLNP